VNDFLVEYFKKVMDYEFTAQMEADLDKIAEGKKKWVPVIREFYEPFEKKVESVIKVAQRVKVPTEATDEKCPDCKEGLLVIRTGRFGKFGQRSNLGAQKSRFGKFLSCSRFPDCKHTAPYIPKLEGVVCEKCGADVVIRKTRKGKQFYGCSNYPKCDWASWRKPNQGELTQIGLGPKLTDELVQFRKEFNPHSYYLRLCEKKITPYFIGDKNYPTNLQSIDSPPFVLYVEGEIKGKDNLAIAVVGTRQMTGYGGQIASSLTTELVAAGLTIVSGLARGVDTMAHKSTLKAGGRTMAVLACGLDQCYPPENIYLAQEIAQGKGAVISEFPLGMKPTPRNFPARNRIIAGLSLGTVVIEGAQKSGSLITARHAAEQGREVFAVPGPITSRYSAAPAHLIKMGAKLVFETKDILEELRIKDRVTSQPAREVLPESEEEEILLSLIKDEAKHLDVIVRESGLGVGQVTALMSMMEIKGKVRNLGGMNYIVGR
ncbi:DNA-processing protein DprA, partial [Patescibacteria group bacterium]